MKKKTQCFKRFGREEELNVLKTLPVNRKQRHILNFLFQIEIVPILQRIKINLVLREYASLEASFPIQIICHSCAILGVV